VHRDEQEAVVTEPSRTGEASPQRSAIVPPNLGEQRAAMRKLAFLEGRWAREARMERIASREKTEPLEMMQTEEAQYKLDGLILLIEGVGCNKADGKAALQALGIVSYDDAGKRYQMRAFNDGRFLETEVELLVDGKGLRWGFALGNLKTSSLLRINEQGEWTESHEITINAQMPRKFMELKVKRVESLGPGSRTLEAG
jgi:hypothetical protein